MEDDDRELDRLGCFVFGAPIAVLVVVVIVVSLCLLCGCASQKPHWKAEIKPLTNEVTITVEGGF